MTAIGHLLPYNLVTDLRHPLPGVHHDDTNVGVRLCGNLERTIGTINHAAEQPSSTNDCQLCASGAKSTAQCPRRVFGHGAEYGGESIMPLPDYNV